jgi:hypothetical protein
MRLLADDFHPWNFLLDCARFVEFALAHAPRAGGAMRRSFLCVLAFLAFAAFSGAALAEILTLHAPVELRTRPTVRCPVTVIAPADTDLTILGDGRNWIPVALNGERFFASRAELVNASPAPAPGPDPTCDYGYPYSGSGLFFARPLAQFRHGPLGFLLGTHRFYPC